MKLKLMLTRYNTAMLVTLYTTFDRVQQLLSGRIGDSDYNSFVFYTYPNLYIESETKLQNADNTLELTTLELI